jgi:Phosphodiester glycosidase
MHSYIALSLRFAGLMPDGAAPLVLTQFDEGEPTAPLGLPHAPDQSRPRPPPRRSRSVRRDAQLQSRRLRHRRIRRGVVLVLVAVMLPIGWSYYRVLTAPGTDPWPARSVEWLRDHGMSGVVDTVEHWWFTANPPPVGGKPEHGLPHEAGPRGVAVAKHPKLAGPQIAPHLPLPAPMRPLVATPLPNEGVWQATGRQVAGLPAVYTAFFRPDSVHTSLVASAMWMDTKLLRAAYVVGLHEPSGGPQTWGAQVPVAQRAGLVAAFNSGFKMDAAQGGVYTEGQMIRPLLNGAASLVITKSGVAKVGVWGRDFMMSPDIASVRQNLALILDHGQPAPGLPSNTNGAWGATLGNRVFVWRSGVGVDRNGGLVYVAGPGLSAVTLAVLLQRAGAVQAMELDINPNWTTAYTYQQTDPANPSAVQGVKLLPDMVRGGDRYLVPGERDFFAMLAAR